MAQGLNFNRKSLSCFLSILILLQVHGSLYFVKFSLGEIEPSKQLFSIVFGSLDLSSKLMQKFSQVSGVIEGSYQNNLSYLDGSQWKIGIHKKFQVLRE